MSKIRHIAAAPTETRHLAPGDEVTPHRHEDHQLIYASSGVLEVLVKDGTWYTPSVRAVWIPRGTTHHWYVHGATTVHMVGISAELMGPIAQVPFLVPVQPLLRELIITCARSGYGDNAAERRLLKVLVDQLQPSTDVPTKLPELQDRRLRKVQQLLEADMTITRPLREVGRLIGASDRTLSRLFTTEVGMSYPVWRRQLRLHRATLLLARGHTVTQVATACGFSSASAFITTFRNAFGHTPGSLYQ